MTRNHHQTGKPVSPDPTINCVRSSPRSHALTGQSPDRCGAYQLPPIALSGREKEILALIAGDGSDREVALKLYLQRPGRSANLCS